MSENFCCNSENEKTKSKRGPRKRQVHNEVERRRKDKINNWIMKISELLPNKELHKASKISILEQTVSYIQELAAERSKLLSDKCTDVQAEEVKSLKRKLKSLEEQNVVYAKLLQQANISLTSLPKKSLKYSGKFTDETAELLQKKLNSPETANNNEAVMTISEPSQPKDTSNSLPTTEKSKATKPNILAKPLVSSNNGCPNGIVNVASILNVAPCTTMLNAGGVTSALPQFPVMSSTLGSSLGNTYNKAPMQFIILPPVSNLIQPSLIPSNISLVGPSMEPTISILMPSQTVPTAPITLTPILPNNRITYTATNVNDGSLACSLDQPNKNNSQLNANNENAIVSSSSSQSLNSVVDNTVPSATDNAIKSTNQNGNKDDVDMQELTTPNDAIQDESSKISEPKTPCKNSQTVTTAQNNYVKNQPLKTTPQSLQVLSANTIISIVSRCQSLSKTSATSQKSFEKPLPSVPSVQDQSDKSATCSEQSKGLVMVPVSTENLQSSSDVTVSSSTTTTTTTECTPTIPEPMQTSNNSLKNVSNELNHGIQGNSGTKANDDIPNELERLSDSNSKNDVPQQHMCMTSSQENNTTQDTGAQANDVIVPVTANNTEKCSGSKGNLQVTATDTEVQAFQKLQPPNCTVFKEQSSLAVTSVTNVKSTDINKIGYMQSQVPSSECMEISNTTPFSLNEQQSDDHSSENCNKQLINVPVEQESCMTSYPQSSLPVITPPTTINETRNWNNSVALTLNMNNATLECSQRAVPNQNNNHTMSSEHKVSTGGTTSISSESTKPNYTVANKLKQTKKKVSSDAVMTEVTAPQVASQYSYEQLNTTGSNCKSNETQGSQEKMLSMKAASDILAKAAESIFGENSQFHSMEDVPSLSGESGSEIPFDVPSAHYVDSNMQSIASSLSQMAETHQNNFQSNTNSLNEAFLLNVTASNNASKFNSPSKAQKRQSDSNNDSQMKKFKDHYCPTSASITYVASNLEGRSNVVPSLQYSANDSAASVTQKHYPIPPLTANLSATTLNPNSGKQMCYPEINYSANSNVPSTKTPVLIPQCKSNSMSQSMICTSTSTSIQSTSTYTQIPFKPPSSDMCGMISHPIDSLFGNSSSGRDSNAEKNNFVSHMDSRRKSNECSKQNFAHNDDMNKKDSMTSTNPNKECIPSKPNATQNTNSTLIMQHLPIENRSYFDIHHLSNSSIPPANNLQPTYSFHAVPPNTFPQVKVPSNCSTGIASIPSAISCAPPPPLMSCNPDNRNFYRNTSSVQSNSTIHVATSESTRQCQVMASNANSLSHSLCSLLKDTRFNVSVCEAPTNSVLTNPSIGVPPSTGKTKYSALSLISVPKTCAGNTLPRTTNSHTVSTPINQHHLSTVACNRNPKSSLSYSAERLIQNQCNESENGKNKNVQNKKSVGATSCGVQELYKSNTFMPVVCSDINVTLTLPPVTTFPTFPAGFSMCDVRPSSNVCSSSLHPYQDTSQSATKDSIFPETNLAVSAQSHAVPAQASIPLSKSNPSISFNMENHSSLYSSCNFLPHSKNNLDMMKAPESNPCFQPMFGNSNYPQQVQKQNYCPFIESSTEGIEKNFSMVPPTVPPFHNDKVVGHEHRPPLVTNIPQNAPSYLGNIFYEPANCSHEAIPVSKSSNVRPAQENYVPLRNKQTSGQGMNQNKNSVTSKGKNKKSKHSVSLDGNACKEPFNTNTGMNLNVFTMPDFTCSKSSASNTPSTYSKCSIQPLLPILRDSHNQQGKTTEPVLTSVMHDTFNPPPLHPQSESFLNLNFQPPTWNSDSSIPVPPTLTLPPPSATKATRSFSAGMHPVPNFNLSNILPDMGSSSSNNEINISAMKFPTSAMPQGHQDCHSVPNNTVSPMTHQTCAAPLYSTHPPVMPNTLPPLLAPGLNRSQPPMPVSCNMPSIPQASPFVATQTPPFRNVIHSLNFPCN